MRTLSLALASSLLLLAADAAAQSRQYPVIDESQISSVQVTAPAQPVRVLQEDLDAVSGMYGMSNGWRLKVDPRGNGLVARIDRQRAMRLLPLSRDRFASRDGNVVMRFNLGDSGQDMEMSYVPDPRLAQVVVVRATLAQR